MSKPGLSFFIEGARITVEEMGVFVTSCMMFDSEKAMEEFSQDAAEAIMKGVAKKVLMAQEAQTRAAWISRHPPNHAGFYYCHICAGHVHVTAADLDEIDPRSFRNGLDPLRDDNRRMAHAWPQYGPDGKLYCVGNRGKGSSQIESKTLDIAPPDEAI